MPVPRVDVACVLAQPGDGIFPLGTFSPSPGWDKRTWVSNDLT